MDLFGHIVIHTVSNLLPNSIVTFFHNTINRNVPVLSC